MKKLTLAEVLSLYENDKDVRRATTKLNQTISFIKRLLPDFVLQYETKMTFYQHDWLILECGEYSNNALVPFGSSAQCYWKSAVDLELLCDKISSLDIQSATEPFVTEALGYFATRLTSLNPHCTWVNSTVCDLTQCDSFDDYLDTLTAKRRYKVKQALTQSSTYNFIQEPFSIQLHSAICDFLFKRWGQEHYPFAYLNYLWATVNPTAYWCMYDSNDILVGVAYFILQDGQWLFQGIASDNLPNIGAMLLCTFVQEQCKRHRKVVVNPTCKTHLGSSSIDIYKRLITNSDCYYPLIASFKDKPWFDKPYCLNNTWFPSDAPVIFNES